MPSATTAFAGAVLGIDVSITVMVVLGSNSGINFMRPTVACTRNRAARQLKAGPAVPRAAVPRDFVVLRDAKNKDFAETGHGWGTGAFRPAFSGRIPAAMTGRREMALCDISVCLDATAAGGGRLELALNLAQTDMAHLTAVYALPEPRGSAVPPAGVGLPPTVLGPVSPEAPGPSAGCR
jgi:hypothetical protein